MGNKKISKGKLRFAYFIIAIICIASAYFIGTKHANPKTETTTNPVIPTGYINANAQSFNERYIDTNAIESVYETKDGFEVVVKGEVFSFDCKKGKGE